jgi:hypothetical protein
MPILLSADNCEERTIHTAGETPMKTPQRVVVFARTFDLWLCHGPFRVIIGM